MGAKSPYSIPVAGGIMRKLMPGLVVLFSLTVLVLMAASPSSRADDISTTTATQDGTNTNIQTDGVADGDSAGQSTTQAGGGKVSNTPIGQKFSNERGETYDKESEPDPDRRGAVRRGRPRGLVGVAARGAGPERHGPELVRQRLPEW